MTLGRFHPVDRAAAGATSACTARLLADGAPGHPSAVDQRSDVAARWAIWRAEKRRRLRRRPGPRASRSAAVFDALERHVPDDAVIAVDVGNNAYSFGRYFECRPPARPDVGLPRLDRLRVPGRDGRVGRRTATSTVVAVTGDGGFGQYLAEITTAVKYGMDITHVVLDNGELGKITKEQRAAESDVWQTDLRNPDFAAYAELCGARGIRVDDAGQLDAALADAFATPVRSSSRSRCDVDLV